MDTIVILSIGIIDVATTVVTTTAGVVISLFNYAKKA